ncbi:MAG: T9SS type A sorting domain-containing protein [Saprospiraceae bacterium]|nr:T9SS type A sorting domain-containing protein [Saprospiraceae bacterium]
MSRILLLFGLSIILLNEAQSQCQPLNGSFEEWTDYTDSFEYELGLELTEAVILPTGWLSLIRLLDVALSNFIIDYLDQDTLDIPIFEGIQQYMPGADGSLSAARISGDSLLETSDLIQLIDCGGRPDRMTGFVKYEGNGIDTLSIYAVLHNSDLLDTADAIGYALFRIVGADADISRDAADFVPFSVDFRYNNESIPDSVSILIITTKDVNNTSDTSFFVIDEIKFEGGSVPTRDYGQEATGILVPNPAYDRIRFNLDVDPGSTLELFDAMGLRVMATDLENGHSFSMAHLPSGIYTARIFNGNERQWQRVIVSH